MTKSDFIGRLAEIMPKQLLQKVVYVNLGNCGSGSITTSAGLL